MFSRNLLQVLPYVKPSTLLSLPKKFSSRHGNGEPDGQLTDDLVHRAMTLSNLSGLIKTGVALTVAAGLMAASLPAQAGPILIDSDGPNHNGVRLHVTAVQSIASMDGSTTGSRVIFTIECRKNHGGNVKGYGAVVLTNLANPTEADQKVTLRCDEDGPNKPFSSNSHTNVEGNSSSIMIPGMSPAEVRRDYAVIGKVERNSSDWFEAEWGKLEKRFGDVAKNVFLEAGMKLIPLG